MPLQISGKDLGALAMQGFCPRCFWISRRAKLPWQIFPGIFSSIDWYSKKVVHGQFDKSGMPGWLAPLGELKGYRDPPSAQRFRVPVEEHGLLLTGGDGRDRVQLNAYAYIARRLGWNAVSALALVYTEPVTTDEAAAGEAAQVHALEAPPAAREGCGDCGFFEKIRGLLG